MMYETSYNIITFLFCYFSFWPIFVMALMYILWCATWLAHYKCHIITSFFIFTLRTSIFHFFLYISNAKIYVCIKSSVSTVTTVSKHSTLTNIHILIKCRILKLLVWFWSISQTDYLQWQKCHLTTVSCMEYVRRKLYKCRLSWGVSVISRMKHRHQVCMVDLIRIWHYS